RGSPGSIARHGRRCNLTKRCARWSNPPTLPQRDTQNRRGAARNAGWQLSLYLKLHQVVGSAAGHTEAAEAFGLVVAFIEGRASRLAVAVGADRHLADKV